MFSEILDRLSRVWVYKESMTVRFLQLFGRYLVFFTVNVFVHIKNVEKMHAT